MCYFLAALHGSFSDTRCQIPKFQTQNVLPATAFGRLRSLQYLLVSALFRHWSLRASFAWFPFSLQIFLTSRPNQVYLFALPAHFSSYRTLLVTNSEVASLYCVAVMLAAYGFGQEMSRRFTVVLTLWLRSGIRCGTRSCSTGSCCFLLGLTGQLYFRAFYGTLGIASIIGSRESFFIRSVWRSSWLAPFHRMKACGGRIYSAFPNRLYLRVVAVAFVAATCRKLSSTL